MGWFTGWDRRKLQTITGTAAGAQTDFQLKMTVHKGSGSDSSTDVYCSDNCRDDFGDIRWTQSDGTTLMDYWIEVIDSGNSAIFWIEIPSIPEDPDTIDIYMYYDKDDETSVSNGSNTFSDFFDDFSGTLTDLWNVTGSPEIESETLKITGNGTPNENTLASKDTFSRPFILEWEGYYPEGANAHTGYGVSALNGGAYLSFWYKELTDIFYHKMNVAAGDTGANWTADTWESYKIMVDPTNGFSMWREGASIYSSIYTIGTDSIVIHQTGNALISYWDNVRIRKYADPEPTWGDWGSEELEAILKQVSDSGTGAEIVFLLQKQVTVFDSSSGVDGVPQFLNKWILLSESGSGIEDLSLRLSIALYDTGIGVDTVAINAYLSVLDTGVGTEYGKIRAMTDHLLFRGPIENVIYDSSGRELELSGRGMEQLLSRYYTDQHPEGTATGRLTYSGTSVYSVVEDLLRGTPVTVGAIDSIYSYATASFRFDFISRLEAINQIADAYGAKFWVDDSRKLYFETSRGSTAPVWIRENIEVSGKTVDYTNLINKLTVLGKGDGIHQLKKTVERTASQSSYGLREGAETRRDIIDENVLEEYGEKLIDITSEPTVTFEITVPWTDKIQIGDTVRITDKKTNLDGSYKVVELRVTKDSAGRDELRLVMSNKVGRFDQLELWTKMRILEKSARGSAMVHLFPNSCTAGTVLTTDIYIPEETEEITGLLYLDKCLTNITWSVGDASLYVDSNDRSSDLGGPWGTSPQSDLDITQWVTGTGWHEIKIVMSESSDIRTLVKTRLYSHAY